MRAKRVTSGTKANFACIALQRRTCEYSETSIANATYLSPDLEGSLGVERCRSLTPCCRLENSGGLRSACCFGMLRNFSGMFLIAVLEVGIQLRNPLGSKDSHETIAEMSSSYGTQARNLSTKTTAFWQSQTPPEPLCWVSKLAFLAQYLRLVITPR